MRSRWLLVLAGCGAVVRPPDPSRRLEVHTAGELFESTNGYVFAALPEANARVVRLDIRYPVGSADDPPNKEGLAHFVEHLLYELPIQRRGAKTTIGAELGRLGLSWNAETHADYTDFWVLAPPEALEEIAEVEVDRLARGCTGLTPDVIAREREVVLAELRERGGASGGGNERALYEAIYPQGHPYRSVETVDSISHLDISDVCTFIAGRYHAGAAYVIASGAVDSAKFHAAATHFARLRARTAATTTPPPPLEPRPGRVRVQLDFEEPMVIATWPMPPMESRDYRMLQLVWDNIADRVDEFGFTYQWGHSAYATIIGGAHAPVLAVGVTLSSLDKVDEAISSIHKSVEFAMRVLGHLRDDREWVDAWHTAAADLLSRWESFGGRNEIVGDLLEFDPSHTPLTARVAELAHGGPGGPKDLAEHWLSRSRARYIVVEPAGDVRVARAAQPFHGSAEVHGVAVDPSSADRPLVLGGYRKPLAIEHYELGNGLRVVLWPDGSTPLVHGRLVVLAGTAHDPKGAEGVAHLIGATDVGQDALVFSERHLAIRVDAVVSDLAFELRFPGRSVSDKLKDFLKARLRRRSARDRAAFDHDLVVAVYGADHPYARTGMTEDSVERIHHDLVMGWARDHLVANNSVLVLAGNFDAELIKKHVAYNADQVKGGERAPIIEAPARGPKGPQVVTGTTTKPSPTIELDVAFRSEPGVNGYAEALVLEAVLDARLARLREQKALSYGLSASYVPRRGGGLWFVSGEVDARRAREGAAAVARIFAEMRADPESYRREFVLARQKVLDYLLATGSNSRVIADRLAFQARFDLPDEFYDVVASRVAKLTLAEFQPFVVRELAAERQVFGAYGNASAVAEASEGAKAE